MEDFVLIVNQGLSKLFFNGQLRFVYLPQGYTKLKI